MYLVPRAWPCLHAPGRVTREDEEEERGERRRRRGGEERDVWPRDLCCVEGRNTRSSARPNTHPAAATPLHILYYCMAHLCGLRPGHAPGTDERRARALPPSLCPLPFLPPGPFLLWVLPCSSLLSVVFDFLCPLMVSDNCPREADPKRVLSCYLTRVHVRMYQLLTIGCIRPTWVIGFRSRTIQSIHT